MAASSAGTMAPAAKEASALGRSRLKPPRPLKLRLVDAVALSAAALLVLKVLTWAGAGIPEPSLPAFARAVAKARTGYEFLDPETTGSVGTKEPAKEKAASPADRPPEPREATQPPVEGPSPSEKALLEKLGARRDVLKQRSDELDLREKMLDEAEKKIETGIGDLKKQEDKVDAAAKAKDEAEKQGLKSIVTMYETMKPKDAARVFDRLGHDVLVPLVVAMNPRKMAEILAVMQPEAAERLTVALANRARGAASAQAQAAPALPPGELPAIDPGPAR
ncbi:flagellar motility protein MotE (MotC chaperone) [Methylobacterium aerolatum]|uniref:Flagellar motility protein MotE (MotC chaperone) n=2 Tax=Methylobacterium aerolatum TaxID=418708 RepID=A0ABU0HWR1_9HYPH|nr:flagellar motility protein MotE (MotC chaperone) [Methylobacterium aerolatum]